MVVTLRIRLLRAVEAALGGLLAAAVAGTALAFGGAVWWWRPALGALATLLVLAWLVDVALRRSWRVLASPLFALGTLALALAAAQLAPLPATVAEALSPGARAWHARGVLPALARNDDPESPLPVPLGARSPATLDRPATLRWLVGGLALLAVFGVAAQFADRLGRTYLVWGSVVGAFFLMGAVAVVQLAGDLPGLYGFVEAGSGRSWAPSTADLMATPNSAVLRPTAADPGGIGWAQWRPDRPFGAGGMMGGPGALIALGTLALPLALGLALQLAAPRGGRATLAERLRESGRTGPFLLLVGGAIVGAGLVGLLGGPWLAAPAAIGLALAGLPAALGTGLPKLATALLVAALLAMAAGVGLGRIGAWSEASPASPLADRGGLDESRAVWGDAARIGRDYPAVGAGLGSFAAVHPSYKGRDAASTTARSTLLQLWAEGGAVGIGLLALASLWCLARLPGAWRRVGTADRPLAAALGGAVAGLGLLATIHWTVELPAVAVAAAAVLGTLDRWLAGGTDLFVEAEAH